MQTTFTIEATAGLKYDINLQDAPEALLNGLLNQGLRILFQRATARSADNKMTELEKRDVWSALAKELNDHTWRPGSFGAVRLDPVEKEFRAQLSKRFAAMGVKSTDADKYARDDDRQNYFRDLVIKPYLERTAPDRMADLAKITEANLLKIMTEARATVEAAKAVAIDLDLDI